MRRLAAVRHLFDWLVTGHIIRSNPALSVRGPRHVVRKGKTPVLDAGEARALLDSITGTSPIDLRDKALIGLMLYSFARIGAVLAMKVEDVFSQNRRLWVRLHEKGGKHHEMPAMASGLLALLRGAKPSVPGRMNNAEVVTAQSLGLPATQPPPAPPRITAAAARAVLAVDTTASRAPAWNASERVMDGLFTALPGQLEVALAMHGGGRMHTFTGFTTKVETLSGAVP